MELLNALVANGYDTNEALEVINEMRQRVMDGEDPEEILFEEGLEPDYIMDILM
jgi:hypothetical protein